MALNDDDITTSGGGGEGTADGGSNPKDTTAAPTEPQAAKVPQTAAPTPRDTTAAPTEPQAAKVPQTAAPTPKDMTAAPTEPRNRFAMLSRCVAIDPHVFATDYWGRRPLLSRSGALPRDFSDLLSPASGRRAHRRARGSRTVHPSGQRRRALSKGLLPRAGGLRRRNARPSGLREGPGEFASGATIVLQGLHRLWPPLIDFVRAAVDDLGHPAQANAYITPPSNRGFDPHYDVHDVFVLQTAGQKRWVVHEPVLDHPLMSQPWTRASRRDRRTSHLRTGH